MGDRILHICTLDQLLGREPARTGKPRKATAGEIYGRMPNPRPFDLEDPPDIKNLYLELVESDEDARLYIYTNGCYSFGLDMSEADVVRANGRHEMRILAKSGKGLFRITRIRTADAEVPQENGKPCRFWLDIRPPKAVLHDGGLFDLHETERLVLAKTMLDLNGVLASTYGGDIAPLDYDTVLVYYNELRKRGIVK